MEKIRLKNTSKYPTTLLVKGLNYIGIEIAKTLTDQGGYVIIIDELYDGAELLLDEVKNQKMISLLDIVGINSLEEELRRLDYIYYFSHDTKSYLSEISTQDFLQESNYLDTVLDLAVKYQSKFLLTTSIKAHQFILENKDLNISKLTDTTTNEYSETEIQRYAEKLCSEYNEKLKLDSRIIRIGEVLGDGVNPLTEARFMNLIIASINNKPLEIPGDGLETDFYAHYLDVARGLIKAMFSLNTKGKTFSLAIPDEISLLSIAYKIAEIEPNSGEISFIDYSSTLPPLRLYRPATNLTALGYEYKVPLDRALKQTIDFIRKREEEIRKIEEETTGDGTYAYDENVQDVAPEAVAAHGALARLIAERKMQEKSRKGSVVIANEELRKKVRNKDMSLSDKVYKQFNVTFDNFKKKFQFLKYITLREFIFYIILILGGLLFYIYIASPIFNMIGSGGVAAYNIKEAKKNLEDNNLTATAKNFKHVSDQYKNVQNRLADLNFLFSVSGQTEYYAKIQDSLSIQKNFFEGMYNSYNSIAPIYDYLNKPHSQLITRLSDETMIDVQTSTDNFDFSILDANKDNYQFGVEKLKVAQKEIDNSLKTLPRFVQDDIKDEVTFFNSKVTLLDTIYKNYSYTSLLLGGETRTTYLFMLQDNTRYTAGGGKIAGYALISMEDGLITYIKVNDINATTFKPLNLTDQEQNNVNLVISRDIIDEIGINDISYVVNGDLRSDLTKRIFEENLGRKVDIVMWLNLNSFESLLQNKSVNVNNVQIGHDTLLSSINLISGTENKENRDQTISQIWANILLTTFNDGSIIDQAARLGSLISSKDSSIYTNTSTLKPFINQFKVSKTLGADYMMLGINSTDSINSLKYPSLEITGKITIREDFSSEKRDFKIKTTGLDNLDSAWYCLPPGSTNINSPADPSTFSVNFANSDICALYIKNTQNEYILNYNSLDFDNEQLTGYNYIFQLIKPEGVDVRYEIEFIFETNETVIPETIPTLTKTNRFTFSGELNTDLNFKFNTDE